MKSSYFTLFGGTSLMVLLALLAFSSPDLLECLQACQDKLSVNYAPELDHVQVKKADIQLTKEGFFRYRRTLSSGKQEYFAFNLSQLEELDYLGTSQSGFLVLHTRPESIIVQTFHDSRGNIDSMANEVRLPLKGMLVEDITQMNSCLLEVRDKLNLRN
ncbi:MAG: hypothetical protein ACKOWL_07925 [Sphingobacteriaceae bacterium]